MSKVCQISKKGPLKGNTVSKAHNKRRKTWGVNLHSKRVYDSETGKWVRIRVSSRILRTIDKKGLSATLKDHGMTLADVQ